jgi:hypothetical protein
VVSVTLSTNPNQTPSGSGPGPGEHPDPPPPAVGAGETNGSGGTKPAATGAAVAVEVASVVVEEPAGVVLDPLLSTVDVSVADVGTVTSVPDTEPAVVVDGDVGEVPEHETKRSAAAAMGTAYRLTATPLLLPFSSNP